jgi:hypothetical protein
LIIQRKNTDIEQRNKEKGINTKNNLKILTVHLETLCFSHQTVAGPYIGGNNGGYTV